MRQQDISSYRLISQQISHTRSKRPEEVVSLLGAMQAQDYLAALWAIGLRLPGSTQAMVERAIAQKKIVRSWPIRGTLHFVSSRDIRWMLNLLKERKTPDYQRRIGLNESTFRKGREALLGAFERQGRLTRDEISHVFEDSGIAAFKKHNVQRHILFSAARDGLICFGPNSGRQPTFTLLEDWVPKSSALKREEALATMAKRYFVGHGPATFKDFVWWSGLKVADARAGIEMASSQSVARNNRWHRLLDVRGYRRAAWRVADRPSAAGF